MNQMAEKLPILDNEFPISKEKADKFQQDGHAVIRDLANREETQAYLPVIGNALEQHKKEQRKLEERDTYHKAFIQVGSLWTKDEGVKRFVMARRFAHVAAQLMGVDGVRIYNDQALFKEPHGGFTPWHQDQYYWPIDSPNTITMWMPLEDCPLEMGALVFATGQHKEGSYGEVPIGDESAAYFSKLATEKDWPLSIYELKAGDATFHAGWTPHKAPGNATDKPRPVMTVIYIADQVKVSEPTNEHQPVDMKTFFPGLKPGDVAASELNPLVWHKDWK